MCSAVPHLSLEEVCQLGRQASLVVAEAKGSVAGGARCAGWPQAAC